MSYRIKLAICQDDSMATCFEFDKFLTVDLTIKSNNLLFAKVKHSSNTISSYCRNNYLSLTNFINHF